MNEHVLLFGAFCTAILILWVVTLFDIVSSEYYGNNKTIWVLIVILLPGIGCLLYYIVGKDQKINNKNKYGLKGGDIGAYFRNTKISRHKNIYSESNVLNIIKKIPNEYIVECQNCKSSIPTDSYSCYKCNYYLSDSLYKNIPSGLK